MGATCILANFLKHRKSSDRQAGADVILEEIGGRAWQTPSRKHIADNVAEAAE